MTPIFLVTESDMIPGFVRIKIISLNNSPINNKKQAFKFLIVNKTRIIAYHTNQSSDNKHIK